MGKMAKITVVLYVRNLEGNLKPKLYVMMHWDIGVGFDDSWSNIYSDKLSLIPNVLYSFLNDSNDP